MECFMSKLKMRNKFFISLLFLLTVYVFGTDGYYSDPYDLTDLNIQEDFVGTYLPVDYEKSLLESKSHQVALNTIKSNQDEYTVLFLKQSHCHSDQWYSDGFNVKKNLVEEWTFVTRDEDKIVIDQNGYEYRKISENSYDYKAIYDYILNNLLEDYISRELKLENHHIVIKNQSYWLILESSYTEKYVSAFLDGPDSRFFIIISGNDLKLVKAKRSDDFFMQFDPTDEIIYECKKN